MSYQLFEKSNQSSAPIELYQFVKGVDRYPFTTFISQIEYQGLEYTPTPIVRDRLKQSKDILKNGLSVTLPRDNSLAKQFIASSPDIPVTLTIFRGQDLGASLDFITYWKGRIVSSSVTDNHVKLECESLFTTLNRVGLRAKFELSCRHALYGVGCNVNNQAYRVVSNVLSVNAGVTIEVQDAAAFGNNYYTGGILKSLTGEQRFILKQIGTTVTISRPIFDLTSQVEIFPGCDHLIGTCNGKFNNVLNFGGFPYIPQRNPFDGSSII